MKEHTIWTVSTNSDLTEGRGNQYVKHYCRTEATAMRLAKRGYVQGSDCPVDKVTLIEVEGGYIMPTSFIRIMEPSQEDLKLEGHLVKVRSAHEKAKSAGLTDEEITLLSGMQP